MSNWVQLRAQAREQHRLLLAASGGDPSAAALLAAAAELTGIHPLRLPAGDPLLEGALAMLDRDAQSIFYSRDTDPALVPLLVGHEYAHLWLGHGNCTHCSAEQINLEASEENVPLGIIQVQGYSPEERREREANVFARELLLPSDALRRWYLEEGLGAPEIVARTGLPEGIVFHQLGYALLTPEQPIAGAATAEDKKAPAGLDDSQRDAAYEPEGPVLVEAGPGTGKTRTLVARAGWLLERGVEPESILGLTFSIKAAEEMRDRIAQVAPDGVGRMQVGTFHSFGLEVLRQYGHHLGYPPRPKVLDPVAALFLMERMLPEFGLVHYQNLYEPTSALRDLLGAISRAKDELRTPDDYEAFARAMLEDAAGDKAKVERAERALEVARVYRVYQARLDREKWVDFADLIFRTVDLLRTVPAVRADLGARFRHILVDEYQDVNRASGALLEELAQESGGRALWVVGDARQSIYRWRGASSANLRMFREKFPHTKHKVLAVNYRSQPPVVDLVSAYAPLMQVSAGQPFVPWKADRGTQGGRVQMEVASDARAEALNIAREIERRRSHEGVPFRSHAVLCRSHTQLARVAAELEGAGVPVLYLGDVFERPEIRDMLALLSLVSGGRGRGLVRVARFPEYRVPLADVRALFAAARERGEFFPRALALADEIDTLSEEGRKGLKLIAGHLEGLQYGTTAWSLLAEYLFARSGYVRGLLAEATPMAQQRLLALYQFMEFAHQNRRPEVPESGEPKRDFLHYVRLLEVFGEEKQLRDLPVAASALDAVRLLTVHGSKGLQFPVVYVPGLGAGMFPANRKWNPCPAPEGLVVGGREDMHDEEEECLFFVATSRAEDVLCLSRPAQKGAKRSNPSRLLLMLEGALPSSPGGPVTWEREAEAPPSVLPHPQAAPEVWDARALEAYLRCPRQYFYERVLGLGGNPEDAVYVKLHRSVYEVVRWLQAERAAGREPDPETALEKLDEVWADSGPVGHAYESMYRDAAEAMVRQGVGELTSEGVLPERPEWEVRLSHGRVRVTPDHLVVAEDGTPTVYRLRTGRLGSGELKKPIYALYQRALAQAHPRRLPNVQAVSLSTGERRPAEWKSKTVESQLQQYDDAMVGIQRGHFPPEPADDRGCPRCPHYFICPVAEDG